MSTNIRSRVGDENESPYAPSLAKSDEDVLSMWNRSYQSRRLDRGRKAPRDNSCCIHLVRLVCTYLIHIFAVLIFISFIGMTIKVASFNPDEIFDKEIADEIERQEWYINHNPFIYGLESQFENVTIVQGLIKYAKEMHIEGIRNTRVSPEKIPHPLYVELQK